MTIGNYVMNQPVAKSLKTYRMLKYFDDGQSDVLNAAQRAYIKRVEAAVSSLPKQEREIITKRFMKPEANYITDKQVYEELMISSPSYNKIRNRALKKLEIVLGLNKKNIVHES